MAAAFDWGFEKDNGFRVPGSGFRKIFACRQAPTPVASFGARAVAAAATGVGAGLAGEGFVSDLRPSGFRKPEPGNRKPETGRPGGAA